LKTVTAAPASPPLPLVSSSPSEIEPSFALAPISTLEIKQEEHGEKRKEEETNSSSKLDTVRNFSSSLPLGLSLLVSPRFFQIPSCVLLTGVTGFLGAFLLSELLVLNPNAKVYCSIRANNDSEALSRLQNVLKTYRIHLAAEQWVLLLFSSSFFDRCSSFSILPHSLVFFQHRIHVLVTDLTLPRFGWSEKKWEELSEEVEAIIHNAALVYSLQPYNHFKSHNVEGKTFSLSLSLSLTQLVLLFRSLTRVQCNHFFHLFTAFSND
jgi:hypothetical protein